MNTGGRLQPHLAGYSGRVRLNDRWSLGLQSPNGGFFWRGFVAGMGGA